MNLISSEGLGRSLWSPFPECRNVWTSRNHEYSPLGKFDVDKFFRQLAVGTGVGVRYDMGMFVIRVDWGIGLHVP